MALEVFARAADDELQRRADRDRDHVLMQRLAKTDSRVAAGSDDVGERVIHDALDLHLWMQAMKLVEAPREDRVVRRARDIDSKQSCRRIAQIVQAVGRLRE